VTKLETGSTSKAGTADQEQKFGKKVQNHRNNNAFCAVGFFIATPCRLSNSVQWCKLWMRWRNKKDTKTRQWQSGYSPRRPMMSQRH